MSPVIGQGRTIGLMGGSFNPAHEGHLHIAELALQRLGLDSVWWLVSPQNPLKTTEGMASLKDRLAGAEKIAAGNRRVVVTDIERGMGTQFTLDTVKALQRRYPKCRFVWIMGADNLAGFHRWRRWDEIFRTIPIAVFARPNYTLRALASKAARIYKKAQVPEGKARGLASLPTPAWTFLRVPLHPQSSTDIRARKAGQ